MLPRTHCHYCNEVREWSASVHNNPTGFCDYRIGTPKEFDLVDIECEGETLAVFDRDIKERTEEVRVGKRIRRWEPLRVEF